MKLTASTESTSLAELIWADWLALIESKRWLNEPVEIQISVASWDSVFIETIDEEADTTESLEITSTFRFKTFWFENVFVIASDSTDFYIQVVW